MIRFGLKSKEAAEDRKLPEMPLHFTQDNGQLLRYNLRKLGELPYHLARAGRTNDLLSHCLFNYDWMYAKVRSAVWEDLTRSMSSCVPSLWPLSWQTTRTLDGSVARLRSNKSSWSETASDSGDHCSAVTQVFTCHLTVDS